MAEIKFFNRYNPKPIKDGTSFKGHDEVCDQQSAELCEINKLLHQFEAGEIDQLPVVREAQYNDILITPQNYADAKALIDKVTNDYFSLPVETQRAFGNLETYVADITKIANGDSVTLQKYNNFSVTSPQNVADVNNSSASGTSSSSISRSDSEISTSNSKPASSAVSLEGGN